MATDPFFDDDLGLGDFVPPSLIENEAMNNVSDGSHSAAKVENNPISFEPIASSVNIQVHDEAVGSCQRPIDPDHVECSVRTLVGPPGPCRRLNNNAISGEQAPYYCYEHPCQGLLFRNRDVINEHMKANHSKCRKWKCSGGDFFHSKRTDVVEHMKACLFSLPGQSPVSAFYDKAIRGGKRGHHPNI